MSQTPVPPGFPPQPPFPPPPGGYYQGPGSMPPEPRRSNPLAITSLVLGILLCIPFISGVGAVLCGIIGIGKAKDPRVGGKGMAIAGLILGLANLLLWGLLGSGIWALISGTATQRTIAKQFIQDLSSGNINGAAAACHSTMPRSSLEQSSKAMQSWGALQDVTALGVNANTSTTTGSQVIVAGAATFAKAQRSFTIEFIKENGAWKIRKFEFPGP